MARDILTEDEKNHIDGLVETFDTLSPFDRTHGEDIGRYLQYMAQNEKIGPVRSFLEHYVVNGGSNRYRKAIALAGAACRDDSDIGLDTDDLQHWRDHYFPVFEGME